MLIRILCPLPPAILGRGLPCFLEPQASFLRFSESVGRDSGLAVGSESLDSSVPGAPWAGTVRVLHTLSSSCVDVTVSDSHDPQD